MTGAEKALAALKRSDTHSEAMYYIENKHELIIDRETWLRVQEIKGVSVPAYMRISESEMSSDLSQETGAVSDHMK